MLSLRVTRLALLLALGASLVGCDSGDTEGGGETRIEDLAAEVRYVRSEAGDTTFEDAAAFLDLLPFEPLYPSDVPGDLRLTTAVIYPSPFFERDGDNSVNTLWLEYGGDEGDAGLVNMFQRMLPSSVSPDVRNQTVDVGGFEGVLLDIRPTEEIRLLHTYGCDITVSLTSHGLSEDELIAMAASMLDGCPPPSEE